MWCEAQFTKFDTRIKLDKTRRERIESAVSAFTNTCQNDRPIASVMAANPFLQGSVPTRTAIKPLGNDEYDVDVILPIRLAALSPLQRTPEGVFQWFQSALNRVGFGRGRLSPKSRCIRANYAGDFHVDIIPATQDVSVAKPYAIPSRDRRAWLANDPIGFASWLTTRDRASGMPDSEGDGVLVRSIRAMKRWRDQFFGNDSRPSSILLTTMLGRHEASTNNYDPPLRDRLYPEYRATAAYLYDLLRLTQSCMQRADTTAFTHPTLPEDLRRDWDEPFRRRFLDRLSASINALKDGIWNNDDRQSATAYQRAFGETFPIE